MTVWTFGGSYVAPRDNVFYKEQWIQLIANGLNTDLQTFGLGGSSLDWVYKNVIDNLKNIKSDDTIIITLTTLQRRWLLKDHPEQTNLRESPTNNTQENLAIKYYTLYLDNPIPYEYYLLNFLYMLENLTKKLNLHTVILHTSDDTEQVTQSFNFDVINIAKGSLFNITFKEYTESLRFKNEMLNGENLVNHMLKSNHKILADKILSNIKFREPINLYQGFEENLIIQESFTDYNFCMNENFGKPLNLNLPNPFVDK